MISTHILDTSVGSPAADVKVDLFKVNGEVEDLLDSNKTNTDGRIKFNCAAESGKYKLVFHIEQYYKEKKCGSFFSPMYQYALKLKTLTEITMFLFY